MLISMIRRAQTSGLSLNELKEIVAKKVADKKLSMPLAFSLIENKVLALEKEYDFTQKGGANWKCAMFGVLFVV